LATSNLLVSTANGHILRKVLNNFMCLTGFGRNFCVCFDLFLLCFNFSRPVFYSYVAFSTNYEKNINGNTQTLARYPSYDKVQLY